MAMAFKLDATKWTLNRTVVMHLSLGGAQFLQDGSSSFNESAAAALNIWNQHLAHLRLAPLVDSPLPTQDFDANNSVFFSRTIYGDAFGANTLAITLINSRNNVYTETDVVFNSARTWDSYRGPRQGSRFDLQRVALHEFGHVFGLEHPDDAGQRVDAIMNSEIGDLDSLLADDIAGANALYGSGPPFRSTNPSPDLVNLSTRGFVGTGNNVLIGGFIVQGSQPATIILRAIGSSLAARGLSNALKDPMIELFNASGTRVAENDDWVDSPNAETITSFRLDPPNSRESALFRSLNPGSYTVVVRAFDNGDGDLTGTGLVELFDLNTSPGRVGNISTRGQIFSGDDILIGGFIIGGNEAKEVVVRGLGPSLARSGISNALSNPTVELRDAAGNLVSSNDNWEGDLNADRVRSANLAPQEGVEAAFYANLSAGAYTAIMRGVEGATGVGLIEIYDLTPPPP